MKVHFKFILKLFYSALIIFSCSHVIAQDSQVMQKTVLVKKFREDISLEQSPILQRVFSVLKVTKYEPFFKYSQPVNEHRVKHTIDLSLYYIIEYESSVSVENAISLIINTKHYELVEPKYTFDTQYLPNDPLSDSTRDILDRQNHLIKHNFFEAWDITKGDPSVVIGIIDTGFWSDHKDLEDQIFQNSKDTIDGINNDGNSLLGDQVVDDYVGWDVADNDNNPNFDNDPHGVVVAGAACASPENLEGGIGVGFYTSYLPIKATKNGVQNNISHGYEGIIYAAEQGVDVMNLSWGSTSGYSQIFQDIINYAVIDYDVAIFAASGNSKAMLDFYPASYQHVFSVAATRLSEKQWGTYSYFVDINAQGVNVMTTIPDTDSAAGRETGTSLSCPIVSGAAALVREHFPELNGLQVGERIRVTGYINDTLTMNDGKEEKMGRSLDAYQALTATNVKSARAMDFQMYTSNNVLTNTQDTIELAISIHNYLTPLGNLNLSLTTLSNGVTILNNGVNYGSMGTLDTNWNYNNKFTFIIDTGMVGATLVFRAAFEDDEYSDYQYFYLNVNSYTIDTTTSDLYEISVFEEKKCNGEWEDNNENTFSFTPVFSTYDFTGYHSEFTFHSLSNGVTVNTKDTSELYVIYSYDQVILPNEVSISTSSDYNIGDTIFLRALMYDMGKEIPIDFQYVIPENMNRITSDVSFDSLCVFTKEGEVGGNDTLYFNVFSTLNTCDADSILFTLSSQTEGITIHDSTYTGLNISEGESFMNLDKYFKAISTTSLGEGDTLFFNITYISGIDTIHKPIEWVIDTIKSISVNEPTTGLKDITEGLSYGPNPVEQVLIVNLQNNNDVVSYEIVEIQGALISIGELVVGQNQIEIPSEIASGLYLLKFISKTGEEKIVKLVVKNNT